MAKILPKSSLVALERLHGHLHKTVLGLAIWEATDGGYRALRIVLGQCSGLLDSIGTKDKIARLRKVSGDLDMFVTGGCSCVTYQLDITRLLELPPNQCTQLGVRLPREQERRCGQTKLQIRTSRLAEVLGGSCVVQHIVDELERETEIPSILVSGLHRLWICPA